MTVVYKTDLALLRTLEASLLVPGLCLGPFSFSYFARLLWRVAVSVPQRIHPETSSGVCPAAIRSEALVAKDARVHRERLDSLSCC